MIAVAELLLEQGYATAYLWVLEENRRAIQFYERLGGVRVEKAIKSIFGYDAPSYKISWSDLSAIRSRV